MNALSSEMSTIYVRNECEMQQKVFINVVVRHENDVGLIRGHFGELVVPGANMNKLLKHAGSFPPEAKESYKEKISFTGSVNPFALSDHLKLAYFVAALSALPPADASDLVIQLVLQTNFATVVSISNLESYTI